MGNRSSYANKCLFAALIITFGLFTLVFENPKFGYSFSGWTTRDATVFYALILLLIAGGLVHWLDRNGRNGFKAVHIASSRTQKNTDSSVVSGMVSVQSMRATMTGAILAALITLRERVAPTGFAKPLSLTAILHNPTSTFLAMVLFALAISTLTTIVAVLCYDYAIRFDWTNKTGVKQNLLDKAHRLGVIGFYGLMWSLAAVTALFDPYVCIVAVFAVFFVLWYYYFFPTDIFSPPTVEINAVPDATQAVLKATVTGAPTSAVFEYGDSTKYGSRAAVSKVSFESTISGLQPGTAYYYRFVNGALKSNGTFSTREK